MRRIIARICRRLFPPSETLEGYESSELVEVIFRKTVAFQPQEHWPEMNGASSVIDFGGGCGLHYKQANSATIRWAVVETPAMVKRAQELATDRLQFFTKIDDAARWLGAIDVMHSNGAIQYAPDPERTLRELCNLQARIMLWHRIWFSQNGVQRETQISHLADNGPGSASSENKAVKYDLTRFPISTFIEAHHKYKLEDRGPDWFRFNLR